MFDRELLLKYVDDGLVIKQKHPNAELYIYNYSQKVQYDKLWNEITLITRGLILDEKLNIIAKPFSKFFNLSEHTPNEIPNLPFDVYEKMDGSLGILYWLEDKPYIATRGSFVSEQAIHGTNILYNKYSHLFDKLDKSSTYLFEIIYPKNRIVVDYGDYDDLVLLSIINNENGNERLDDIGFTIVKKYNGVDNLQELKSLEDDNREGFVVRFKNGFRIKVKFDEYVRLHRILTCVSNITVWEYLSENKSFDELLERVPDEFYNWIRNTQKELLNKFSNILSDCEKVYKELPTRKETALYFKEQTYPHILFAMLDKKNIDGLIWKLIKPEYSKPFNNDLC